MPSLRHVPQRPFLRLEFVSPTSTLLSIFSLGRGVRPAALVPQPVIALLRRAPTPDAPRAVVVNTTTLLMTFPEFLPGGTFPRVGGHILSLG